MIRRILGFFTAILMVAIIAITVYAILDTITDPAKKPVSTVIETVTGKKLLEPLIRPYTKVKKVNEYIYCGDTETYYWGPAPYDLIGLDYKRLEMKYPQQDNWKINNLENEVIISKKITGFCGMHQEYRHLGIKDGKLAVYQGPLGYEGLLLRVENNIDVNFLPEGFRKMLYSLNKYKDFSEDEKIEMQKKLEFPNEQSLNHLLENFDELSE